MNRTSIMLIQWLNRVQISQWLWDLRLNWRLNSSPLSLWLHISMNVNQFCYIDSNQQRTQRNWILMWFSAAKWLVILQHLSENTNCSSTSCSCYNSHSNVYPNKLLYVLRTANKQTAGIIVKSQGQLGWMWLYPLQLMYSKDYLL